MQKIPPDSPSGRPVGRGRPPLPEVRVLVVDDSPVYRFILARLLNEAGVRFETAGSGHEALARLDREPFDLVLIDCHLPGMSGWETARRIRRHPGRAGLALAVMTADSLAGVREDFSPLNVSGYLSKPITPEDLYALLAGLGVPPARGGGD